jgi:hypothetical protein
VKVTDPVAGPIPSGSVLLYVVLLRRHSHTCAAHDSDKIMIHIVIIILGKEIFIISCFRNKIVLNYCGTTSGIFVCTLKSCSGAGFAGALPDPSKEIVFFIKLTSVPFILLLRFASVSR